jgi:hypothetical protein
MKHFTAVYEVVAGTPYVGEAELEGLSPDDMAIAIDQVSEPNPSVCHQCADGIDDPQVGDLVGFVIDGKSYMRQDDGTWIEDK